MFKNWFKKREKIIGNFGFLSVDMHSHLVPGIDDGSKSAEESLEFIEKLEKLGFRGLITTPHIISDIYPNNKETIESAFRKIKLQKPAFQFDYAAEYMINAEFEALLDAGDLLTFAQNHVLVEMSYIAASANFRDMIFQLKVKGYQPVLAHPERYLFLHNTYHIYQEFKDLGCLLQLNILSITGYYGAAIKKVALKLLADQLYDLAGTDLHHERHLAALTTLTSTNEISLLQNYGFRNAVLLRDTSSR
jgi:protein-tyrosine phosphatase